MFRALKAYHQEGSSKIQALWYNVRPRIWYMVSHQCVVDTQQEEGSYGLEREFGHTVLPLRLLLSL